MSDTPDEDAANEWDESADGWDGDEATRAYAAGAFSSLVALIGPETLTGMKVLDFGCGTGLLTEHLMDSEVEHVYAVDTSPAMLAVLDAKIADRGWSSVVTAPANPTNDDEFDLVVCSSVLGFVDDYSAMVTELVHLLKPGGHFVQWDWERVDGDSHGLSRSEIAAALGAAGLVDVTVEIGFEADAYGQIMRPLMGAGRRLAPTTRDTLY